MHTVMERFVPDRHVPVGQGYGVQANLFDWRDDSGICYDKTRLARTRTKTTITRRRSVRGGMKLTGRDHSKSCRRSRASCLGPSIMPKVWFSPWPACCRPYGRACAWQMARSRTIHGALGTKTLRRFRFLSHQILQCVEPCRVQPPDAENRRSGGVGGWRGQNPPSFGPIQE